jgi:transcriptional regulator with XRE-family HTH domain
MSPGELLKAARRRHGVSQAQLAIRAGTTQSAISRIERDRVSPKVRTLRELLLLLGEDLDLGSKLREWGIDRSLIRERLDLTAEQRLDYARALADQVIELSPNVREEAAG